MNDKELNKRLNHIELWANNILKEIAAIRGNVQPETKLTPYQKQKLRKAAIREEITALMQKRLSKRINRDKN